MRKNNDDDKNQFKIMKNSNKKKTGVLAVSQKRNFCGNISQFSQLYGQPQQKLIQTEIKITIKTLEVM